MSSFKNYSRRDLVPQDRADLAAALTTIYIEGMGHFPPNPKWDDTWWNEYSIGYIPNKPSFITINASEGESDQPDRFMVFSINTSRQAVTWKVGKLASNATPVPQHLQPFMRQLTVTVHGIAAKREQAQELARQKAKEKAEEERKYYEANKEKIDAERTLARKKMEEEEKARKEEAAKEELKHKINRRKSELDHASRVKKFKASSVELTASPNEEPTKANKMLELAKRGPEHDLCETCAETLRFCAHEGCTVIGCIKCFENNLVMCAYCCSFVCCQHGTDFNHCSKCECHVCEPCGGQNCWSCEEFACDDCSTCGDCDSRLDNEPYLYDDDSGDDYLYGYSNSLKVVIAALNHCSRIIGAAVFIHFYRKRTTIELDLAG